MLLKLLATCFLLICFFFLMLIPGVIFLAFVGLLFFTIFLVIYTVIYKVTYAILLVLEWVIRRPWVIYRVVSGIAEEERRQRVEEEEREREWLASEEERRRKVEEERRKKRVLMREAKEESEPEGFEEREV
ncbi:hypothetical protein DL95DRAFT_411135 [Leptodontidium sp. 2 PMI_412]|nr:hypothetical protein DL95DRAFT_411135 [Leptodontidium sp. 2 PMI_412]